MYETKPYFYGTGRRKSSVARVRVYNGTGKITINDRDIDDYFGLETLKLIVRQPLTLAEIENKFDIVVRVAGGGVSGQADLFRLLRNLYIDLITFLQSFIIIIRRDLAEENRRTVFLHVERLGIVLQLGSQVQV